jgi:hypothetical protein
MANLITEISATGYRGKFAAEGFTGTFAANSAKVLTTISGARDGLGSFDAYKEEEDQFSYNLHPVSLDKAGELATLAGTVVDAVGAELQE